MRGWRDNLRRRLGLRRTRVVTRSARESWRASALPILVIALWWLVGLGFYAVGWPIDYTRINVAIVVAFILSNVVFSLVAYLLVVRRARPGVLRRSARRTPLIVLVGLTASALLLVPWANAYSGFAVWQVFDALRDQGAAFLESSQRIEEGSASRITIVMLQSLAAPAAMTVIPFTALAWFESRRCGLLLVGALLVQATMSILVGRDVYLLTAAILCLMAWYIARVRTGRGIGWRALGVGGLSVFVFLLIFGLRKQSRGVPEELCLPGASTCMTDGPPTLWDSIAAYVVSYASQPMEGLGRAFLGEWAFGGGYRHSQALGGIVQQLSGRPGALVITDQLSDHEWSDTTFWSTGFAWIANDVPWVLVPLVVAVISAILALSWRRSVAFGDWLSVAVFAYGWFSLLFLSQNLTLATNGPQYIGYLVLTGLFIARELGWLFRRRQRSNCRASWSPLRTGESQH